MYWSVVVGGDCLVALNRLQGRRYSLPEARELTAGYTGVVVSMLIMNVYLLHQMLLLTLL